MASFPASRLTVEQYLEQEAKAQFRSEYFQGEVFAMTGNTRAHALLVTNLSGDLRDAMRRRDCRVYTTEIRLGIPDAQLYTYPDVLVTCGAEKMRGDASETVLNPVVIMEVLSPSTEAYDRGKKFELYRSIASLQEYVLVAQDRVHVEQYLRQPNGSWLLNEYNAEDPGMTLSIGIELELASVYEKVLESPPRLHRSMVRSMR